MEGSRDEGVKARRRRHRAQHERRADAADRLDQCLLRRSPLGRELLVAQQHMDQVVAAETEIEHDECDRQQIQVPYRRRRERRGERQTQQAATRPTARAAATSAGPHTSRPRRAPESRCRRCRRRRLTLCSSSCSIATLPVSRTATGIGSAAFKRATIARMPAMAALAGWICAKSSCGCSTMRRRVLGVASRPSSAATSAARARRCAPLERRARAPRRTRRASRRRGAASAAGSVSVRARNVEHGRTVESIVQQARATAARPRADRRASRARQAAGRAARCARRTRPSPGQQDRLVEIGLARELARAARRELVGARRATPRRSTISRLRSRIGKRVAVIDEVLPPRQRRARSCSPYRCSRRDGAPRSRRPQSERQREQRRSRAAPAQHERRPNARAARRANLRARPWLPSTDVRGERRRDAKAPRDEGGRKPIERAARDAIAAARGATKLRHSRRPQRRTERGREPALAARVDPTLGIRGQRVAVRVDDHAQSRRMARRHARPTAAIAADSMSTPRRRLRPRLRRFRRGASRVPRAPTRGPPRTTARSQPRSPHRAPRASASSVANAAPVRRANARGHDHGARRRIVRRVRPRGPTSNERIAHRSATAARAARAAAGPPGPLWSIDELGVAAARAGTGEARALDAERGDDRDTLEVGLLARRSADIDASADCSAGRFADGARRLASGRPSAARAKIKRSARLLINVRLVANTVAFTVRRDTLTSLPERNVGWRWILRSVSTARPIAHRQKRRMPTSRFGIMQVYSSALRRCACARPMSSSRPSRNSGVVCSSSSRARSKPFAEHRARQPACVRLPIVPDVFQDVRHLQTLAEGHGELEHRVAMRRELAGSADRTAPCTFRRRRPRRSSSRSPSSAEVCEPAQALVALKLGHARAHDAHAARQRGALRGREAMRDADDGCGIRDEIALRRQRALATAAAIAQPQTARRLTCLDDGHEARDGNVDFCSLSSPTSSSIVSARRQSKYALVMTSASRSGNTGIVSANVRETPGRICGLISRDRSAEALVRFGSIRCSRMLAPGAPFRC